MIFASGEGVLEMDAAGLDPLTGRPVDEGTPTDEGELVGDRSPGGGS
jgi:hypothetical protein